MNANELADWLDEYGTDRDEKAATMLRQQADLIRNLQKSLGFKNSGYETINLTPSKELTDEEILAIGNAVVNLIDSNEGWLEFARAILRKAQEK